MLINQHFLVKLFGFPSTLIHGDTLVADRWWWLKKRIPTIQGNGHKTMLDVGCGSGAFTIGGASFGYESLGLSWDKNNQNKAIERAKICHANAKFEVKDVRRLHERQDLKNSFDLVVSAEVIEHIIDDQKLMKDMSNCLKKGGTLLLTTPNYQFIPMYGDSKKITVHPVEDGGHVKIGYLPEELETLCENAGLTVEEISYCSGFFSQKVTSFQRFCTNFHPMIGWVLILPLRILPPLFDRFINYTGYSICLVAKKK